MINYTRRKFLSNHTSRINMIKHIAQTLDNI